MVQHVYFHKVILYYWSSKEVYPLAFHIGPPLKDTNQLPYYDHPSLASQELDKLEIHKSFLLVCHHLHPLLQAQSQLTVHDLRHQKLYYQVLGLYI